MGYLDDVIFPDTIALGARGGPGFNTGIIKLDSGAEERISWWPEAVYTFNIATGIKSLSDVDLVRDVFLVVGGARDSFRFKDPFDHNSSAAGRAAETTELYTDQLIGTGDGTTTTFQLRKTYTRGSQNYYRPITKPIDGTVLIGVNGVSTSSGWSVDPATGIVTFTSAPTLGHAITAGFQFHLQMRFDESTDRALEQSYDGHLAGNVPIILEQVRDEIEYPEQLPGGGAATLNISADRSISLANGSLLGINASTTGLAVQLPDFTNLTPSSRHYFLIMNRGSNSFDIEESDGSAIGGGFTLAAGEACHVVLEDDAGSKGWVIF